MRKKRREKKCWSFLGACPVHPHVRRKKERRERRKRETRRGKGGRIPNVMLAGIAKGRKEERGKKLKKRGDRAGRTSDHFPGNRVP